MFAVKSKYSIKIPDGTNIHFYVAGNNIFFNSADLECTDIKAALFPAYYFVEFENYKGRFIRLDYLKDGVLNYAAICFYKNEAFWVHFVNHNDTAKVIAEVQDAQDFCQKYFLLVFPDEWHLLNVDDVIDTLHIRTSGWVEKCHNSLRILATNDEQKQIARRVYDKAWQILKERKKDENRPTVHEVLAKFGLTDDDLINAVLERHQNKFREQRGELEAELRRLLN